MLNDVTTSVGPDHAALADHPEDAVDGADDVTILPWWRNPVTIVVSLIGMLVLAATGGYVVGHNQALPDPNAADIGFLQDMRIHHEQAVQMGWIYLDDPNTSTQLEVMARDIIASQEVEVGRFIQLLRDFGAPESNDTDTAMSWMGMGMPIDEMPGLATDDELRELAAATGPEADAIFIRLMTLHHEGGIDMADHAAHHAATTEVREMATKIAAGQRDEIIEMARLAPAGV
jgi:uncharacterized protein (DUF305 family)